MEIAMNNHDLVSRRLFSIAALCCYGISVASENLELARKTIFERLSKEQPACIGEFKTFFKQYDELVVNFFDKKNNDPLTTHIMRMETELQTLKNACNDERYRCVNPILCGYHDHVTELITLLKHYVGSHDTLSLAFKVHKFKIILPETVRQRGDISLFWSLYHRLRCE
jgi:hypothetical protein